MAMETETAKDAAGEYLTFTLDKEQYGLSIRRVMEILEYQQVTVVPGAPPSIRGVINLRGNVVPVVDLCGKFGLPTSAVTKWTCLVIVEATLGGDTTLLAVVADAVNDVVPFGPSDVAPVPSFGTRVRLEYLLGLGKLDAGFVLLLDADRVLTLEELLSIAPPANPSSPTLTEDAH
jgi:purine-binding chemotaxis protein CheW